MNLQRSIVAFLTIATCAPMALGIAGSPLASNRCSLVPGFFPGEGPTSALLLAVPTADTVWAGPGQVAQGSGGGHSGNGIRSQIFGQRYRVVRAAGQGLADLPRTPSEVILVPWDYDGSCQNVPWARSARWLATTDTVLIRADSRGVAHWAGGIPTFDVTAIPQAVYAGQPWQALGQRRPRMAAAESTARIARVNAPSALFEFLTRRPTADALLTGDESVLDALQGWAIQNDTIARLEPSRSMLAAFRTRVRTARLMNASAPIRGTWRLTIRLRSGQELTQWMRTADVPFVPWTRVHDDDFDGPAGYELRHNMAVSPDSLPEVYRNGLNWPLTIATRAPSVERAWRFRMQFEELPRVRPESAELKALFAEWVELMTPRWRAGNFNESLPGEIALTSDGGAILRIGWDTDGDGSDDVVVRGERVSMQVAPHSEASRSSPNW